MTSTRKISETISRPIWHSLGIGSFNEVFVSSVPDDSIYWVKKQPRRDLTSNDHELNDAKRAVAIWKIINPDIPVRLYENGAWGMPFIAGTKPTDEEIAKTLYEIYQRTGYIIFDGCNPNNFIKQYNGEIVCIDFDLAYHVSDRASNIYARLYVIDGDSISHIYNNYFGNKLSEGMLKSVAVIQNLIELEFKLASKKSIDDKVMKNNNDNNESLNDKSPKKRFSKEEYEENFNMISLDLFLKIYECRRWFFEKSYDIPETSKLLLLAKIVLDAQQSKFLCCVGTRSEKVLRHFGWFTKNNEVITDSGLDRALQQSRI